MRLVIDYDAGDVVKYYTYEPFGEVIDDDDTFLDDFQFTGQYFDAEIEEYYLRARQYNPGIARFTSRDPLRGKFKEPLTLHRYLYCQNDPVNKIDPSGRSMTCDVLSSTKTQAFLFNALLSGIRGNDPVAMMRDGFLGLGGNLFGGAIFGSLSASQYFANFMGPYASTIAQMVGNMAGTSAAVIAGRYGDLKNDEVSALQFTAELFGSMAISAVGVNPPGYTFFDEGLDIGAHAIWDAVVDHIIPGPED